MICYYQNQRKENCEIFTKRNHWIFCMKMMKSIINPTKSSTFYGIIAVILATEISVIYAQIDFFRNSRKALNRSPSARCKRIQVIKSKFKIKSAKQLHENKQNKSYIIWTKMKKNKLKLNGMFSFEQIN